MEPRTQNQFEPGIIEASRSVLVELGVTLKSYLTDLVLIGGWARIFCCFKIKRKDLIMSVRLILTLPFTRGYRKKAVMPRLSN